MLAFLGAEEIEKGLSSTGRTNDFSRTATLLLFLPTKHVQNNNERISVSLQRPLTSGEIDFLEAHLSPQEIQQKGERIFLSLTS